MVGTRLLWLAGLLGLALFSATQLRLRDSITEFVPAGDDEDLLRVGSELAGSPVSRRMALCITKPGELTPSLELAEALGSTLARQPEVASARWRVDLEQVDALRTLLLPRLAYLASDDPEHEVPRLVSDEALRRRARTLRRELARPIPSLSGGLSAADPLGLLPRILERSGGLGPALAVRGEHLVAEPRPDDPPGVEGWAVVLLETRHSAFDAAHQGPLLATLAREFERLAAERGGGFVLEIGGAHPIAVATERSMRRDVRFVSLVSVAGVGALLLVLLGSLRNAFLVLLPVVFGVLFALALVLLTRGSVHLLTLSFGASLVGVAVDYSIHLLDHHALAPAAGGPRATARRLRGSLGLGALTTVAGFAGFASTSFPGVREMGLFAIAGITAALAAALLGLPALLPRRARAPRAQAATAAALAGLVDRLGRRRAAALMLPLATAAIAAVGLPRLHFADDPRMLTAVDPALVAQDRRVGARIAGSDADRFVVARAPDQEGALALNDRVWQALAPLSAAGELEVASSLHAFLWSGELQQRNLAAFRAEGGLAARVDRAFSAEGFRPGSLLEAARSLQAPPAAPLQLDDLAGTPLEGIAASHLLKLPTGVAALTFLRELREPQALRTALEPLPSVQLFDRVALYEGLFRDHRRGALRMVALGSVFVLAILLARYRSPRAALAAALPALLAMLAELGLFGLLGISLNLMGTASLVLILGLGVDYGIFLVDASRKREHVGPTLLSLLLSCLTTIFVFGVLAFSSHPALRSIGLTTGVGVLLAFACAPTSLALVARR